MIDLLERAALSGIAPTPFALPYRGQLVFSPSVMPPGYKGPAFFLDALPHYELDVQNQILDDYVVLGYNEATFGAAIAKDYHGQVGEDTDWRKDTDHVIQSLMNAKRRLGSITLVYGPDVEPYFIDGDEWNIPLLEGDFGAIYRAIHDACMDEHDTVQLEWEARATLGGFCRLAESARRTFPRVRRFLYHNPGGHAAPGIGNEVPPSFPGFEAEYLWRVSLGWKWDERGRLWLPDVPRMTGERLQTTPDPADFQRDPKAAFDNHIQGVWDMNRRFLGIESSPWGAPLVYLDVDGRTKQGTLQAGEYMAYCIESGVSTPEIGRSWGRATLHDFPSLDGCTDGYE